VVTLDEFVNSIVEEAPTFNEHGLEGQARATFVETIRLTRSAIRIGMRVEDRQEVFTPKDYFWISTVARVETVYVGEQMDAPADEASLWSSVRGYLFTHYRRHYPVTPSHD